MVWSYFFFLVWFIYLIASSILLFTKGFLLTRDSFEFNSTCLTYSEIPCTPTNSEHLLSNGNNAEKHSCSTTEKLENILTNVNSASNFCLPARARVVLVIIDALRYDFTQYDKENKSPLPFQNRLPIIQETLESVPEKVRLYKFLADPPTTTMQRLKALTTGSLPTFIDAGSNFASYEIKEDNIIDQLMRNNHSTVFMGDDTWDGLYPKRFKRSYPFPSFNVRDLDTVDRGVSENLYPELEQNDWNLLIAHYLGVDHAGHRYGPNHPEMKRKLEEMNIVLKNIIHRMSDDMILYVLGDHGMTVTGDHGGETENEVSSALYVYSKIPFAAPQNTTVTKQVNIVPTLATVLGVSIPFSNLGSVLHDALPILNHTTIPQWKFSLFPIWSNVEQIVEYLQHYSSDSDIFEADRVRRIFNKFNILKAKLYTIDNPKSFEDFRYVTDELITEIRKMCEEVWIQFDSFSITRGLLLLFLSLFFVFIIADGVPAKYLKELFLSSFLVFSYFACFIAALCSLILYYFDVINNFTSSTFFATGVVSQLMLAMLIVQNWDTISLNWHSKSGNNKFISFSCRLVLVFNLVSLFSNSYIEEEASIFLFLLTTVSLVGIVSFCKNMIKEKSSRWLRYKFILFSIGISILLRLSVNFWRCREEQGSCFSSNIINVSKETTKSVWAVALASLALFTTITKTWLRNCGSLNDYSLSVTFAKYAPTVMVVCTGGYWVLHRTPFDSKPRSVQAWKVDHLVWMVYASSILGIVCTIIQPLLVYVLPRRSNANIPNEHNIIPHLFRRVKGLMEEKSESKNDIPVIYGLGTVFSTVYLVIGVYFTILLGLLLGESGAPSAVIMFLATTFILIVISTLRIEKAASIDDLFEVPNTSILIWVITSHYFFYGTGHQPAWSNIDWNAAFIGTSGVFANNFVQGTLVILNTFCPYIITGFFLPMLVITPFTLFVMTPSLLRKNKDLRKDSTNQGELLLFERSDNLLTAVFVACCKYLACHGIRVFATMLAATVHCRHLMVWKIFAPKFIFESVAMLVTLISVTFGYLVLIRVNYQLEKFINKLNKHVS
ncbi:hypothetical protein HHI36_002273 [Cryptolaemus montrouzieri]|uniref:GPI ethanolamine phosphate transferase 3, catalytic subunit n=1 Tax=Cryptolaemus montrouzieri TaxID=559131 RepID=A0ABD2P9Y9_9CUCU